MKRWVSRGLEMWILVDENGETYLSFNSETGYGQVTVSGLYDETEIEKIKQYLHTSKEWALVAKKNRVDTSKALGCYPDASQLRCERDGEPHGKNQMGFRFFARDSGKSSRLIIGMADQSNEYKRVNIYFKLSEIDALIRNVRLIRETQSKAKETASKQHLFKPVPKLTPNEKQQIPSDTGNNVQAPSLQGSLQYDLEEELRKITRGAASSAESYFALVQQRISDAWRAPSLDLLSLPYVVVVQFRLHRDGLVTDVMIEESSGNVYNDLFGKRAILNASPLPIFPFDITDPYIDARIAFNVSLDGTKVSLISPLSPTLQAETPSEYGWLQDLLLKRIEELKRYPAQAKFNHWEGKVVVQAVIKADGTVGDLRIVESSGHALLDEEALLVMRRASPLTLKYQLEKPQITILVPISYRSEG